MTEIIKTTLISMITNQKTTMIDIKKKKIIEINKSIINIIDNKGKISIDLGILFLGKSFEKTKFSLLS
jgi:hypothetical protein